MNKKAVRRGIIVAKSKNVEGVMEEIDFAVDGIVDNIKRFYNAMEKMKKMSLSKEETIVYNKVIDIMDTAVSPYMTDIITALDEMEVGE